MLVGGVQGPRETQVGDDGVVLVGGLNAASGGRAVCPLELGCGPAGTEAQFPLHLTASPGQVP